MSEFTKYDTELMIKYHRQASDLLGKDHWVVTESFVYSVGSKTSEVCVPVVKGYLTDGASVPRALWSLIQPWGVYGQAVVLHDYLCDYPFVYTNGHMSRISREEIDEIFNEAMKVLKVPTVTRLLMYNGVKLYTKMVKGAVERDSFKLGIIRAIQDNCLGADEFQLTQSQFDTFWRHAIRLR